MPYSTNCFHYILALGSNLGDRESHFHRALGELNHVGKCVALSRFLETKPLVSAEYPTDDHEHYLNAVCIVENSASPREFYLRLQAIEDAIGHARERKWLPRQLDIDILFAGIGPAGASFADCSPFAVQTKDGFTVPHKDFWQREFLIDLVTHDLSIPSNILQRHTQETP